MVYRNHFSKSGMESPSVASSCYDYHIARSPSCGGNFRYKYNRGYRPTENIGAADSSPMSC